MSNQLVFVRFFSAVLIVLLIGLANGQTRGQDKIDFGRDIRPILSDKCFACHGPDEQTREGGFRLDVKADAFAETDSGRMRIEPGKPDQSELVRRITAHDDEQMPPLEFDKRLKPDEIERLKRWIAEGANWTEHWAFITPIKPTPPSVTASANVTNPIDQFVIARLESKGLKPSPMAAPQSLIRRVSFDLTGLPPTIAEVDAFVAECNFGSLESAYEKLVDRLLASPHYGEQMSSEWLDAARYADSNGYQNDFGRDMWPWRDWVIQAFNDNLPFDQFTIEQIAGDMLPNATDSQMIATGFNRNHRSVTEGGSIEEEWRVENIVDRVETTATTFLGLTMGCARCHDHKYDPISQEEFYQFYAYFNSIDEKGFHSEKRGNVPPLMKVHSDEHEQRLADVDSQITAVKLQLRNIELEMEARKSDWRAEFTKPGQFEDGFIGSSGLSLATGLENDALNGADKPSPQLMPAPIGNALSFNRTDKPHLVLTNDFEFSGESEFSVSAWVNPEMDGAILSRMNESDDYRGFDMLVVAGGRLEVHLIHQWPTNAIKIITKSAIPFGKWTHVCVTYDGSQKADGLTVYFNHSLIEQETKENSLSGSTLTEHPIWIGLRHMTPRFAGRISQVHAFESVLNPEQRLALFASPLHGFMAKPMDEQTDEQKQLAEIAYQSSFGDAYVEQQNALTELKLSRDAIEESAPTTMILKELDEPRETFVLNRGQYDQPDRERSVNPGIAKFLPQPDSELPNNRMGLARWMVDPQNPLTARVAVNRFWQHYFGSGLVATPENFGVQSPAPMQQNLLDWMAVHFIETGWNVKSFQKLIVMSSTYRQSSEATPTEYAADPSNAWLGRGPRFRLSSESIRDNALAASGLLNPKIGGPSVKPYQPEGLWKELAGGASQGPYVQDTNDNIYRRGLYIYRKRTVPPPSMTTFDAGSREICQVARARTNTPLQALALLNDTTYVEASRRLAEKSIAQSDVVDKQICFAFQSATARLPDENELSVLRRSYDKFYSSFESTPKLASQLIEVGDSVADPSASQLNLAALTVVCSMIFNLDETVTKE